MLENISASGVALTTETPW